MRATEHKWYKTKESNEQNSANLKEVHIVIPHKQIDTMRSGRLTEKLQILENLHFEDCLDRPLGNSTVKLTY